jgi:hypothetical protein
MSVMYLPEPEHEKRQDLESQTEHIESLTEISNRRSGRHY